jgi:outer membrane protein assembly factor BamB
MNISGRFLTPVTAPLLLCAVLLAMSGCSVFSTKDPLPNLPAATEPGALTKSWSASVGKGGVGFAPTLVNNQIFAAALDGTVVRLNAVDGTVAYRVNVGKELSAGVGSDGNTAVVVSRDGEVIALEGDGKVKWRAPLKLDCNTPPAVGVGVIVVRSMDNRVVALDIDSGKQRWSFQRPAPALVLRQNSAVAMSASTAFVGLSGGRLVALSLDDGTPRWEAQISPGRGGNDMERIADVVGSPLILGREVCAVAVKGAISCLDTGNGQMIWQKLFSSSVGLDIDPRLVVAIADDGKISAFTRSSPDAAWVQDAFKRRFPSAPVLAGKSVVFGSVEGDIVALGRDTGTLLSRVSTDGSAIVSQPVSSGKQIIVQTANGTIHSVIAQ